MKNIYPSFNSSTLRDSLVPNPRKLPYNSPFAGSSSKSTSPTDRVYRRGANESNMTKSYVSYSGGIFKDNSSQSLKDQIFSPGDVISQHNDVHSIPTFYDINRELFSLSSMSSKELSRGTSGSTMTYPSNTFSAKSIGYYYLPERCRSKMNKKTLVLDLDETLVHSAFKPFYFKSDIILNVEVEHKNHVVHVLKRPYVEEFLERMSKHYELVIFTASISHYANPLMDKLDPKRLVSHRLFREHCVSTSGVYLKDLKKLGRDLREVIILDNNPISYAVNPENGLPILTWHYDKTDTELLKLIPILEYLAYVPDVRDYIKKMVFNHEINFKTANAIINTKTKEENSASNSRQIRNYNEYSNKEKGKKGSDVYSPQNININIINHNFSNVYLNDNNENMISENNKKSLLDNKKEKEYNIFRNQNYQSESSFSNNINAVDNLNLYYQSKNNYAKPIGSDISQQNKYTSLINANSFSKNNNMKNNLPIALAPSQYEKNISKYTVNNNQWNQEINGNNMAQNRNNEQSVNLDQRNHMTRKYSSNSVFSPKRVQTNPQEVEQINQNINQMKKNYSNLTSNIKKFELDTEQNWSKYDRDPNNYPNFDNPTSRPSTSQTFQTSSHHLDNINTILNSMNTPKRLAGMQQNNYVRYTPNPSVSKTMSVKDPMEDFQNKKAYTISSRSVDRTKSNQAYNNSRLYDNVNTLSLGSQNYIQNDREREHSRYGSQFTSLMSYGVSPKNENVGYRSPYKIEAEIFQKSNSNKNFSQTMRDRFYAGASIL